ncbi:Kelch repeat-containing protein [Sphingorhabdus sp. Alg231-15]|uniref:Kelch repeat-containing protein n=1 Tax=Sphingorhabdus sp. Alg231-15 TaxID=1922222 RepID=UPI000D5519F2
MKRFIASTVLFFLLLVGAGFLARAFLGWNDGMREARSEIHAATLNGKLYVAGGIGLFRVLDSCETLDLESNGWSDCGELPRALHHVAMAADDQHVYASGGYVALPFETDKAAGLFRYDPDTGIWTEISKLPHPIGQHAMTHFGGALYLIGGQDDGQDLDTMWRYDIADKTWLALSSMPTARHSHAIGRSGPLLYVTGGRSAEFGSEMKQVDVYHLTEDRWGKLPNMPQGRGGHGAFVSNNNLHIFGGESLSAGRVFVDHDILDLETLQWSVGEPINQPRHGFAVSDQEISGSVTIVGGGARPGMETLYSVTSTAQTLAVRSQASTSDNAQ